MLKSLTISAAMIVALSVPAFAMEDVVKCNATNKENIMKMAEKNPDKAMMKKAMKSLEMASKMAAAGDIQGCREDLMKAMKAAEFEVGLSRRAVHRRSTHPLPAHRERVPLLRRPPPID